jgi:hypothetical protein
MIIPAFYVIVFIVENFILPQKRFFFLSFSICIGCIGLLILIFKYFSHLMLSDKLISYKTQLSFWVATGLLIYFLGSLPFFGMFNILAEKYMRVHYAYYHIILILSTLMYCFFVAGIYFTRKLNNRNVSR